ncbi:MAG: RDD family protein [Candidatus Hodarchaeales archaeon]|jgi:uncharacterized RDD family membrane protein YckC
MEEKSGVLKLRILAYFIDFFLILLLGSIGFIPIVLFLALAGFPSYYVQPIFRYYSQINVFLFPLPYFIIQERVISTTLGKRLCDLETLAETGTKITYKESFIRNLSRIRPELVIIDLIIGFLISPTKQRFLEIVSTTTVINADKLKDFTKKEQSTLNVFKIVLSILGFLFILLMMFGTYLWPLLVNES